MATYFEWDLFTGSTGRFLVYLGKLCELLSGILLILGLFTRIAAIILVGTFLYITFIVGKGQFWYGDQHPFLFVLLGVLYFFIGPGAWSLDSNRKP